MAVRVTADELKEIFETDLSDTKLGVFISMANIVVNERLSGKNIAAATLKEIERLTAAHMASVSDPRAIEEEAGGASAKLEARARGSNLIGLQSTFYGQQAMMLDPTGTLSDAGKRVASVKAIGPFHQVPVEDSG